MFFHFFFSCNGDRAAQNVLPGHGNVLTSGAASPECSRGKSVQLLDRHRLSQVAEHDAAEVYVAVVAHPVSVERELGERAVPVEKAIPSEQKSVDLEHLSHWLDKYDGKYAVGACSCRRSRRVRDEGRGHLEGDMCIAVGDMATYAIETNKARPATREEIMEILQRAEGNGFVHQITNIDGEDKFLGICNCCVCSCYALRTSQLFNTPNM